MRRSRFRNPTYQNVFGDNFSNSLAQHQSETLLLSNITNGLENISITVLLRMAGERTEARIDESLASIAL